VDAIKAGLKDGTIDAIATDHAPHADSKSRREFRLRPLGIVGLETAWGLALRSWTKAHCRSSRWSPADRAAGLRVRPPQGHPGRRGRRRCDDRGPGGQWVVEPERFRSRDRNTPFAGWKLKGRVVTTIVAGGGLSVSSS